MSGTGPSQATDFAEVVRVHRFIDQITAASEKFHSPDGGTI
jgi:hypothetical protein